MIYRKIDIGEAAFCLVSDARAKEFIDHRINKKSPLTQGAFERAMKNAAICQKFGITADEAIEIVIDAGWAGMRVAWVENELKRRENGQGQGFSQQPQTRSGRADAQFRQILSESKH